MDMKNKVADVIDKASQAAGSQRAAAQAVGVNETTLTNGKRRGAMQLETYLKLEEIAKRAGLLAVCLAVTLIVTSPQNVEAKQIVTKFDSCKYKLCNIKIWEGRIV